MPLNSYQHIISFLTGSESQISSNLDWQSALPWILDQHLQGLMYRRIKDKDMQTPEIQMLHQAYYALVASNMYKLKAIEELYQIGVIKPEVDQEVESSQEEEGIQFCGGKEEVSAVENLKDTDAPVVSLVNMIIKSAINQNNVRIRYLRKTPSTG